MKLLLDTHLLMWAAGDTKRIAKAARRLLLDETNELRFSVVSLWEITIKQGLGRADFAVDARKFRRGLQDNGYLELPITSEHVLGVGNLPPIHKDPFDRMLIAQATVEGITLLTSDDDVAKYAGAVRRV